ncbi:hypothetical protein AB3N59_16750 [Leptospira sp. WS92.C1]
MDQIKYKNFQNYKYKLVEAYNFQTEIKPDVFLFIGKPGIKNFVELSPSGLLGINAGYAWDGPSGPTIDTKSFMRGSLIHDALYQLMREEKLDRGIYRERADKLLREICLKDGMNSFRAYYVYRFVRWFGESSAKPEKEQQWKLAP